MKALQDLSFQFDDTDEELLKQLKSHPVPEHVALIMDGNRRWAQSQGLADIAGHLQGANNVEPIIDVAACVGIKTLTLFAFSTENWARSEDEVGALFELMTQHLKIQCPKAVEKGVRLSFIGHFDPLPEHLSAQMSLAAEATEKGKLIEVVFAVNYGGRDEIVRAAKKLACQVAAGSLDWRLVSESHLNNALDTNRYIDPQLCIRTSGEQRVSNFMLWQMAYTEFYFSPLTWPCFTKRNFLEAIAVYQARQRRFGV